jgi:hypothetical protein
VPRPDHAARSRHPRHGGSHAAKPSPIKRWLVRGLAVALLLGGVGAALYTTRDHGPASGAGDLTAAEIAQLRADTQDSAAAEQAAQEQAKAAAEIAAARAKAANDEATRQGITRTTTPNYGPIPSSCKAYTGSRAIGCALLLKAGYKLDQMPCLDKLWTRESNWNYKSYNKGSGAYGIPQALPGSKMATVAADWETNPATQITWGLGYIKNRYKTPCNAWQHSEDVGWY